MITHTVSTDRHVEARIYGSAPNYPPSEIVNSQNDHYNFRGGVY